MRCAPARSVRQMARVRDNGGMSTSDPGLGRSAVRRVATASRRPGVRRSPTCARGRRAPQKVSRMRTGLPPRVRDPHHGGRVEVDGVVVRLGTRSPETQAVHVDTMRITTSPEKVCLALNKPAKVVTAMSDPGRRSIAGSSGPPTALPLGRLDYDTEGLLLLTNDGELSNRLAPPYEVPKTHLAQVRGITPRRERPPRRDRAGGRDRPSTRSAHRLDTGRARRVVLPRRNRIVRRLLGMGPRRAARPHRFRPIALAERRPGKLRALRPHGWPTSRGRRSVSE